jgi:hypothetical protein
MVRPPVSPWRIPVELARWALGLRTLRKIPNPKRAFEKTPKFAKSLGPSIPSFKLKYVWRADHPTLAQLQRVCEYVCQHKLLDDVRLSPVATYRIYLYGLINGHANRPSIKWFLLYDN